MTFDQQFRTKNWNKYDEGVGLTGDLEVDPHVYTKVGSKRVVLPLDPRWATSNTSHVMFTSGSVPLSGVGILRTADETAAIVSPVVLAPRVAARKMAREIFG